MTDNSKVLELLCWALRLDQVKQGENKGRSILEKWLDECLVDSRSWSSGRKVLLEQPFWEKDLRERNEEGVLRAMASEVLLNGWLGRVAKDRRVGEHLDVRVGIGQRGKGQRQAFGRGRVGDEPCVIPESRSSTCQLKVSLRQSLPLPTSTQTHN